TVSRVDDHVQLGIRKLQARGERDRAAMRGMERIKLYITRDPPRATDSRYQRQGLQIDLRVDESARKAIYCRSDSAAGTPDVGHAVRSQEPFDGAEDVCHRLASTMALAISSGRCTPPPA